MYDEQCSSLHAEGLRERCSIPRASFIHLSDSLAGESSSRFPSGGPMEGDAHLHSLFYISFRVPSKGALLLGSLRRAPIERDVPPPDPLSTTSHRPW